MARWRTGSKCGARSEEHTSELQSRRDLVCRLLLEKKKRGDGGHVRSGADGAGAPLQHRVADDVIGGGVLGPGDDHAAGLTDAGLLACKLGDGVAEEFLVVE